MAGVAVQSSLLSDIQKAVQREADDLQEEAIRTAVEKFERDLRLTMARTVMSVHEYYSAERIGPNLVITVNQGLKV